MKKILVALVCLVFALAVLFAIGSRTLKKQDNARQSKIDHGAIQTTGDLEGAVADYSAAQHDPRDTKGFYNRALAEQIAGRTDEAIGNYNRTIGLDPKFARAYNNRGAVKQTRGDLDGAIADFSRAIELDPKYAKAYFNRAIARQAMGDQEGAGADRIRARELIPKRAGPGNPGATPTP